MIAEEVAPMPRKRKIHKYPVEATLRPERKPRAKPRAKKEKSKEAFYDETQTMKYKLVSLPRGTARMPVLDIGYSAITIKQGASLAITPQTLNYLSQTSLIESSGYTFTISDVRLFTTFNGVGINTPDVQASNQTTTIGTNVSKTVIGTTLNLSATTINTLFGTNIALYGTLTVEGRDSGARLTIPVTVTQA
jgi:hypothetical protein